MSAWIRCALPDAPPSLAKSLAKAVCLEAVLIVFFNACAADALLLLSGPSLSAPLWRLVSLLPSAGHVR